MAANSAQNTAAASWLTCAVDSVTIQVLVRPGSSHRRIVKVDPRGLVVALNSPPEKGRANDELIAFLARITSVPRSSITIVRGAASRHKTVRIGTTAPAATAAALHNAAGPLPSP